MYSDQNTNDDGYQLIKKNTDCQPSLPWLGKGDLKGCAKLCSSYSHFVHATDGDQDCKCIKVPNCKQSTDTRFGLSLYKTTTGNKGVN